MEKTSFALSLTADILEQENTKVLYISLKMNAQQLAERFRQVCGKSIADFQNRLIIADDCQDVTPQYLQQKIDLFQLDKVIIDYLELLPSLCEECRKKNIEQWLLELKYIAMKQSVSFMVLTQLTRKCDGKSIVEADDFPYSIEFIDYLSFLCRDTICNSRTNFSLYQLTASARLITASITSCDTNSK